MHHKKWEIKRRRDIQIWWSCPWNDTPNNLIIKVCCFWQGFKVPKSSRYMGGGLVMSWKAHKVRYDIAHPWGYHQKLPWHPAVPALLLSFDYEIHTPSSFEKMECAIYFQLRFLPSEKELSERRLSLLWYEELKVDFNPNKLASRQFFHSNENQDTLLLCWRNIYA